ncbi:MAG: anti-sigma factor antagonist [Alphaproteobacteria bacterium]|nr:MAG: anti-sigma factor antagonist [Alphaproteobacteria bacterium]
MDLQASDIGEARVVRVGAARLDAAGAIAFKDGMRELAADAPPRVILDLGAVEFLDSSGLGAVVAVMKELAPERRLELAGLHGAVEKVFRLTRMDKVFKVHADLAAATGHIHAS